MTYISFTVSIQVYMKKQCKVHMQPFQILRALIDIGDKIKNCLPNSKSFLFPRYLFSKLAKTRLLCFCGKNLREIELSMGLSEVYKKIIECVVKAIFALTLAFIALYKHYLFNGHVC